MLQTRQLVRSTALRCFRIGALSVACCSFACADDAGQFYGLLRARDLTPFGSLRLDMRPAHAIAIERGSFVIATELGYQNTWALSPEVESYLTEQAAHGRHELGPADAQAIRELPGENYLLDLESAVMDLTVHCQHRPKVHWVGAAAHPVPPGDKAWISAHEAVRWTDAPDTLVSGRSTTNGRMLHSWQSEPSGPVNPMR